MTKVKKSFDKLNIAIAICVISALLLSLFYVVSFYGTKKIYTHNTTLETPKIDYNAVWEEFEEKEIVEKEGEIHIKVVDYLEEEFFEDEVKEEKVESKAEYELLYDKELNAFTLVSKVTDTYGNVVEEEIQGAPFNNDDGSIDVLFQDDEGPILLSELENGEINECGFLSKLKKMSIVTAIVAVVVAVVAVVLAPYTGGASLAVAGGGMVTAGGTGAAAGVAAGIALGATGAAAAITLAEVLKMAKSMGMTIEKQYQKTLSSLKKLTSIYTLTKVAAKTISKQLEKEKYYKYLLLSPVSSKADLSTPFAPATYEQAVAWIACGGSVYTPHITDASSVISGAGMIPANSKGVAYESEIHYINGIAGFEHFHGLTRVTQIKVTGIHSFFGL